MNDGALSKNWFQVFCGNKDLSISNLYSKGFLTATDAYQAILRIYATRKNLVCKPHYGEQ